MAPSAPKRFCSRSGCPKYAISGGLVCETHSYRNKKRGNANSRGYGAQWRKTRKAFLEKHPFCACGALATLVDHIIALRKGGTHEESNLQPMCSRCHNRKTNALDGGAWGRKSR